MLTEINNAAFLITELILSHSIFIGRPLKHAKAVMVWKPQPIMKSKNLDIVIQDHSNIGYIPCFGTFLIKIGTA
jgi:hypothetical protein